MRWNNTPVAAGLVTLLLVLAGCAGTPTSVSPGRTGSGAAIGQNPGMPSLPKAGSGRGGYYQDDGPGDNPPPGLAQTADAQVRLEAYSKSSNRPYAVFGKKYIPITDEKPFVQRGIGSWYGKKFHGQRTSSGEPYDMYKMTAAHPTLPIPSYARLTSIDSGKQVIVRINDRGPFHSSRVIDVSYTAALKLGFLGKGSHELHIERLLPAEIERMTANRNAAPAAVPVALFAVADDALPVNPAIVNLMQANQMPPAEAEPVEPTAASMVNGFYLQLGAFSRIESAQLVRERVAQATAAPLEVVSAGTLHRVYGGPFQTRAQASEAAAALPQTLNLKPLIVQR